MRRELPGHSYWRHQLSVRVEWVEGECSLAQMDQTLGDPDHEEVVLVLGVVLGQLSQHRGQPRIVGSCSKPSKAKHGVVANLRVCNMGDEDGQLGGRRQRPWPYFLSSSSSSPFLSSFCSCSLKLHKQSCQLVYMSYLVYIFFSLKQ